jgi:hypothetical protein
MIARTNNQPLHFLPVAALDPYRAFGDTTKIQFNCVGENRMEQDDWYRELLESHLGVLVLRAGALVGRS